MNFFHSIKLQHVISFRPKRKSIVSFSLFLSLFLSFSHTANQTQNLVLMLARFINCLYFAGVMV